MLWSLEECLGRIIDRIPEDKSNRIIEEDELTKDESDFDEELKDFSTEMKGENHDGIEAVATISTSNDEDAFYTDIIVEGVEEGLKSLFKGENPPCLLIIEMVHAAWALKMVAILGDGGSLLNLGGWKIRAIGTVSRVELGASASPEEPPTVDFAFIVAQYASDKTAFDDVDQCLKVLEGIDSMFLSASRNDPKVIVRIFINCKLARSVVGNWVQVVQRLDFLKRDNELAILSEIVGLQNYGASLEKYGVRFGDQMRFTGLRSGDIELSKSFWTYEVEYGEVEHASGLKKKSELLTCSDKSFPAKTDLQLGAKAYFQLGTKANRDDYIKKL
ncbi:hypothetical protein NE237_018377 [Protea cynaroides]|uniref:DUF7880 domain-containing protein n=1 Tax=Protea cynaroides TaxID=273540 RepID=A0A9Q0K9S5_9MAGN|nr:hypothetical protein NE237_018377 [Protea cynaroides]